MPTASAFGHSATQSGTGAFQYQSEFPYSVTGLVPALTFFSFRYRDDQMPDSPAFRHKKSTPCKLYCWYRNVGLLLLNLLYDTVKSLVNTGMPEKNSPAAAFLLVVSLFHRYSGIMVSPVPLVTD
jgi:hypothetical protein